MELRIEFCTSEDGNLIAFATTGQGPPFLMTPGWITHLELNWQDPNTRSYIERLAKHHTVIRYDKLGTGLSDRNRTDFSLEGEVKTVEAIVDYLNLKTISLMGNSEGGPIAVAYAAKNADRVTHLILYGSQCPTGTDTVSSTDNERLRSLISLMRTDFERMSRMIADSHLPDAGVPARDKYSKNVLESVSGDIAATMLEQAFRWDVTSLCKKIRTPTIVLHRREDMSVPFEMGRKLASMIPGAHLIPLDGVDHLPMHGDVESIYRNIAEFLGDPVDDNSTDDSPTAVPPMVTEADSSVQESLAIINDMDWVTLSHYRIIGNYTRYDENVRNDLKDIRQKIASAFDQPVHKRENHIIWAAPGSGKTYLVQQVAASLSGINYHEINLARRNEHEFLSDCSQLYSTQTPKLCLIDEVDSKPNEPWPYEALLPHLDASVDKGLPFVFVLVGSSGSSINELKERIGNRPKGVDLLDRIPRGNEYEIPPMNIGDRLLVVLSQFRLAGNEANRNIRGVEKLVLYYIALNSRLLNARQLRELAVRAVERVPVSEDRVKYDHLFGAGDPENKAFWMESLPAAGSLTGKYVSYED